MNTNPPVEVSLEYQTTNEGTWQHLALTPEAYFELEPNETPSLESVERHAHAIDYLDPGLLATLRVTRLTLHEPKTGARRTITETFWNGGKSRVIERIDTGPRPYWEMIVDARISEHPPTSDLLRIVRHDGVPKLAYHALIRDNDDGSQTETRLDGPAAPADGQEGPR